MLLTSYPTPQDYGAAGNGTTDDTTALNLALSTAWTSNGGGVVTMPPGSRYLVSGPVSIPPFTFLVGQTEITLNLGSIPTTTPRIIASASWAPGSAAGIIQIASKTPGGWSANTAACGLANVYVDGSANTSANVNGVYMIGPVYDVHLDNVFVFTAGHNGVHAAGQTESGITPTFPYHCRFWRTSVVSSVNTGFNLVNFTDSTFENCLAFGNGANGYSLQNNANTTFVACRSEWNTGASAGRGFTITGATGSVTFTGCSTDQNLNEGFRITATTPQSTDGGGVVITGGKFHADGNGGTNPNGIKVTGSTVPVVISGANVECGQNGSFYPTNAIEIDTSSNVTVTGCMLQGATTPWSDGGGNTRLARTGCLGATGNPNTQTYSVLNNLPVGVPQVQSSATTVTGVTAETVLQTYTVPANEPVAGSVYHVTGYGVFTIGSGNLTWTIRWGGTGGTSIAAFPTNTAPALSGASFWYDVLLTFRSTTSVTAAINLEINSSTVTDAATSYVETPSTATTVTTSSSTALTVDVTPSVSGDSITLMGGCTRKLA